MAAVYEGFKPFKKELIRACGRGRRALLQVRIRRISLFDINKHREEMEKDEGRTGRDAQESQEPHQYVISHLKALLENTARCIRASPPNPRHEEVDVKAVAFKAFKVAYDRESGYVGYKVPARNSSWNARSSTSCCSCSATALQGDGAAGEIVCRARNCFIAACRSATGCSPAPTPTARRAT
jgi:hypothetical protein